MPPRPMRAERAPHRRPGRARRRRRRGRTHRIAGRAPSDRVERRVQAAAGMRKPVIDLAGLKRRLDVRLALGPAVCSSVEPECADAPGPAPPVDFRATSAASEPGKSPGDRAMQLSSTPSTAKLRFTPPMAEQPEPGSRLLHAAQLGVAEIGAAGALEHVTAEARHIAQLGAGGELAGSARSAG